MEIGKITDQLTRLPAICAGIAAVIVLSLALWAVMRVRGKRLVRANAEKEARRLVGLMRKCPRLTRSADRKLALRFSKELNDVISAHGFALHEVGTSRQEIDRILYLVREDVVANPRYDQPNALRRTLNAKEPGTPGIEVNAPRPEAPAHVTEEEVVLFVAALEAAEFAEPGDGADAIDEIPVEIIEPDIAPASVPSDPLKALQTLGDDELDAFVIERFDAMTVKD